MKSRNKLLILGLLMAVFLSLPSIDAFAATIKWDGGAGTSNWNDANNWDGNAVPTSSDDVILDNANVVTAYTVNVNTAADVNSLVINETAGVTLRPDASSARTMRIRDNLDLNAGTILYTNTGGTGRLAWTFDGAGATNSIDNNTGDEAKMQFADLTIDGAITTVAGANLGDMEIYGTLTVNGSFNASTTAGHSSIEFKGSGKSIVNNGALELNAVTFDNNSSYTTSTDITISDDLTVSSGSSLVVQTPAIMTLQTNAVTLTNNGTLTFNSGASLNVNIATTLVGDLANFDADMSVAAVALTVTSGNQIQGDGSITTVSGSTIVVGDGDGVAGAIELDTYSWNAGTNFQIVSGSTGFSGASISTIGALTFGPTADPNAALAITVNDSFSMSGALTVNANTNTTTVTASSGTITMTGSVALTTNGEVIDFYGLQIDGTTNTVTVGALEGIIVNNYLGVATGDVLDFNGAGAATAYDALTIDGTATILIDDIATGLLVDDYAEIELTGNVTFADGLTLAAQGNDGGINIGASAVVDFAGFVVTTAGAAGNVTTASGSTVKTSHADGIAGNFASTAANVFNAATNYEFNSGAIDFGFDDFDGAGTDITTVNDITINGAAIAETGNTVDVDVTVNGDLTVTTGSLILPSGATGIIIMGTTGDAAITNSTGDEDNLVFNILQIGGANTVTVSGDISIANATGSGLDMNAAGTLDCTTNDASVYIVGATDIANTGTGTYNLHHLVVEAATTINVNVTSGLNIAGDLTLTAPGTLTGGALSLVTFNGTAQQTIETNGQTLSLDLITISNSVGVITNDDMTWSNATGAVTLSGKFVASAGTVTMGGASAAVTVSGNSATFFNLNAGTATSTTGDLSIIKTLSGTAYTQTSDDLTFLGDPTDLDATPITNDSKQIANSTVTTLTISGTLIVDSNCEFQTALAIAGAGTVDVNGRLELTATAAVMAGGTIDISGGTLHLSGTNTTDLGDVAGTLTAGTSANAILDGDQTTAAGVTIVLNDLTLSSTAAIALEAADDITIHGTVYNEGLDMGASNAASQLALAGASASISGDIVTGLFVIDATATGATGDADIEVTGAAGAVTVNAGGAFTATGSLNLNGAGATILNGSDADDLVLHDVTVTTAASSAADFYIGGSLTTAAVLTHTAELTFSGSGETITLGASNQLILEDLTFIGSYTIAAGDFIVDINGDLEVTNTGSFDMNELGQLDFQGAAASVITNDGNLTINDLYVSGGTALTTTDNFTVEGDFNNTGSTFAASGSSLITFGGTTALTATATNTETQFNDITVDGTVTQTNDIYVLGDIIVNGTLTVATTTNATTDDTYFGGGTTKTIQNNGTLVFGNIFINNTASNIVTTATNMTIAGDITLSGTTGGAFNATAGTVTFNGAGGPQVIETNSSAATNMKFYNVTLSTASTDVEPTANSDIYIYGDLTLENDAQFDAQTNDTRVYFVGASEQEVTLAGTGTLGTSAQLLLHNITLNNTGGVKLIGSGSDIMLSQLDVEGTWFLQSGDIDLNGNNILTIDATNSGKLFEPASGGRVLNNGPSTSTGHVYATITPGAALSSNDIGGLGAYITTTADPGATVVKRYHIPLTVGGDQQISRYYSITNANASIGGKLGFKYDTDELGTIDEDDLILVYGDDPSVDVWTIEPSTLNTSTKRLTTEPSVISQFTGQTEWWTAGNPDVLSASSITNGLASSPISAGTDDNAIFGVQFTSNGSVDLSTVRFNLGRALGATNEVTGWKLVYSEDDDFSTSEDNVDLIDVAPGGTGTTGGQTGDSYVTFDVSSEDAAYTTVNEGTPINYFVVVDIVSSVTAGTSTITPSTANTIVTVSGGITEEYSLTGSAYSFRPSIMVSPHEVGITDSPLVANQQDVVLFGFKATLTSASGLPGMTGFALDFDRDPSSIFENVQVYASSTEHDFADMGGANLIATTTAAVNSTGFNFVFTSKKQLATTPTYFFVVADVKAGVNNTTADITPTLTYADITSTDAGIRGTDIDGNAASSHTGFVYSFVNNTVSVSAANNPASSNLGTRVDRQPIYGFTLTPDNNQQVTFTGANITVTLSSAALANNLSNWSLYYDSNENGYPETSEKIANGTLNSTSGTGNLSFSAFTQTLSSARKYLVGVKVGSGATAGTTIKTQLTSTDYLTVSSPARVNSAGPLPATANTHTIRTAGTATALEIVHNPTSVVTGNTLAVTVRAVDANGYPTNVSAGETVTIAKVSGTGTVGGTNTGTIANGTSRIVVSPTITAASGSTDLVLVANGSSLTSSANTGSIVVMEAEPAANDAVVTIANITATTARITNISANTGSTDGRIVVIRQGSAPTVPTDGVAYTANLNIADAGAVGTGQTGAGSYVVMANVPAAAAVYSNDIEGLMPNTRYYVQVFDYNGTTPNFNYATGTAFTSESSRNPISFTTSSGDVSSGSTETAPANIQTDIDITSTISAADEEDWYQFRIPSTRNNAIIRLSNLPANYQVELYDASAGIVNKTLLRDSKVTSTGDEVIILNGINAGPYVLKIYGADDDAYSSSNYTLRVTTSTTEIFSQVE